MRITDIFQFKLNGIYEEVDDEKPENNVTWKVTEIDKWEMTFTDIETNEPHTVPTRTIVDYLNTGHEDATYMMEKNPLDEDLFTL